MEEIWKPVVGWEGLYEVSSLGNVRSFSKYGKKGGVLTPRKDVHGYLYVKLWMNGKWKVKKIHRLVAMAFIRKTEEKDIVDHINTIRTDNRVENLRWCTVKENVNNPISKQHQRESALGRKHTEETKRKLSLKRRGALNVMYGKKHTEETKKKMSRPVIQLTENGEIVAEFYGVTDASNKTGIHRQNISDVLTNRRNHAKGFLWKYKEDL